MELTQPVESEYGSFYAGYIAKVANEDVFDLLTNQVDWLSGYLETLSDDEMSYRYAEGKWSIAEVIGHIIDTERIMSFRMMTFARGDNTNLPGFEQDDYVKYGTFSSRPKDSFLLEMEGLRKANLSLIASFQNEILDRSGIANGSAITVRALIFIIAGHFQHHMEILFEKYHI